MNAPTIFNYQIIGTSSAPPLLFLHGFLGDRREWDDIVRVCAPDYRCLPVDLPGHGKTPLAALFESDGLSSVATALFGLLDALGISSCSAIGYSMGGRLALCMAALQPARFTSLTLESASPGLRADDERRRRIEEDERLAERLIGMNLGTFLNEWYSQAMFGNMQRETTRFDALLKQRLENDPEQLARALRMMSVGRQPSLWDAWTVNRIPTLLVTGECDTKFRAIVSEMARLCPAAELHIAGGCGHNVHYEDPEAYTKVVKQFLRKHSGSPAS